MASIFTFDPDPPRVASPWSHSNARTPELGGSDDGKARDDQRVSQPSLPDGEGVDKLPPEPQEGPIEYKLHLLLRPRRSFRSTSTADRVAGSTRQGSLGDGTPRLSIAPSPQTTPALASSSQSRQHRLQQLTTQLLWRLQQSSPYHAPASKNASLLSPSLELGDGPRAISTAQRASYGLEESRGALYEIGVADDGTFVGLLQDELDESLQNLRIMASTLGCSVEVLRQVPVGEGEWAAADDDADHKSAPLVNRDTLWVAEAFVRPDLGGSPQPEERSSRQYPTAHQGPAGNEAVRASNVQCSTTKQLRITLTGPTMSGKSSLLGILTSGALDNGRGKSRLGLLKHRHEIESGMTSSVTQELMGYAARSPSDDSSPIRIVNYATGDVASWPDVHALCEGGRLVFLSDSAGHPRYRRTTIRGLVGWAPHWTLLCIPADSVDGTTGLSGTTPPLKDLLGCGTAEFDLTDSHLQICLGLHTPLIIAITKLDLASRSGLKQLLAKLLTTLKAAGRRPILLRDSNTQELDQGNPLIAPDILAELGSALPGNIAGGVPIICTSAVNGTGISKLHALLHHVPIPDLHTDSTAAPPQSTTVGGSAGIFHVEDVFGDKVGIGGEAETVVVSGILRGGAIAVGDVVNLGPYNLGPTSEDPEYSPSLKPSSFTGGPRSFPGALTSRPPPWPSSVSPSDHPEWRKVRVVSLRNLRLSVRCLLPDQVGTIGLQPVDPQLPLRSPIARTRKGMVVSQRELAACAVIEAEFPGTTVRELSIGSLVVVYVASVRATARVVLMSVGDEPDDVGRSSDVPFHFDLDDTEDMTASQMLRASTIVHLRFIASREYVTPGDKVLIMPGGGPGLVGSSARGEKGLAGLEGFVGEVLRGTDAHERLERRIET